MMIPSPDSMLTKVGDMIRAAGVDNFYFDQDLLVLCGTRYHVHSCSCDDPDCSGVQLLPHEGGAH